MATRQDPARDARRLARHVAATLGGDIREARLSAGLSQATAARAAAMSHAQFGRIERGVLTALSIEQAFRAAAVVGLRIGCSTYPDGDAVRDSAQLRLLARFRRVLPAGVRWATEVPVAGEGDRRAWDAVLTLDGGRAACEAETRLRDLQAMERRVALKQRDGNVDIVLLLVADTRTNRALLREHRAALRARFPLDTAEVLARIRRGRLSAASGIVVM